MPNNCITQGGRFSRTSFACLACSGFILPAANRWSIAFSCISTICCLTVGWDRITTNDAMVASVTIKTGTSQLPAAGFAVFSSSKTSPGAAKTFIKRLASELAGPWTSSTGKGSRAFSMSVWVEANRVSGLCHVRETAD